MKEKMELNKLYNCDVIELMKEINDDSVNLIVTDPPYCINYSRHDKNSRFNTPIKNDDNFKLIQDYIKECYRILKNNSAIYMFTNYKTIDFFKMELEKYFNLKNIIIWDKCSNGMGDLDTTFGYSYEVIFFCSKGQPLINGKRISDVWRFSRVPAAEQLHQNQKPVELIEQCIVKSSKENDVIFDGFMGSGTTAVASIRTNRNFIGSEIEEKYYAIAKERINSEQNQMRLF